MHVTVNEVLSLVHSLESGKLAGLDGLNGGCLKYADVILSVLLSFCFSDLLSTTVWFVRHLH